MTTETPRWFKSSYSNNGGDCVELAVNLVPTRGVVSVRDSKVSSGPVLSVPAAVFTTFVASVKDDQLGAI
ncbi:DUF397 domain-containing protein [Streptomyces sp. NPDC047014]|uniref:DUF397 domain-containing protein n=1 Tax=Streptomyces sp. NPDC047014 TaxID=3155736 RepID=UPI0033DBAFF4